MSEISNKSSEISDKSSELKMNALAEAHSIVLDAAGRHGTVKERLRRASVSFAELTFNRVRDLFYAEERCRVSAEELDYLRREKAAMRERAARNEYHDLVARVAKLEAILALDEDFYRPAPDALRQASGLPHSSMDR